MANPRKELEVFPGFQQCLGWNKALLPCWKFSRILEKREGKRGWNFWREENRTPRTSRVFWESLIPAGFGRNLQIPSKFPQNSLIPVVFSFSQSSSLGIFSTQIPQFFPLEVIPGMKFFPKNWIFPHLFHGNPDPRAPPGKLQRTWISLEFFGGLRVGSFYSGLGFFLGIKENPRCRWNSKKLGRNPKEIPKSRDFSSLLLWLSPESRAGIPMGASRGSQLPWIPGFFWDIWDPTGIEPSQELWDPWIWIGNVDPKIFQELWDPCIGIRNVDPHGQLGEFSLVLALLGSKFPVFIPSGSHWDATTPI